MKGKAMKYNNDAPKTWPAKAYIEDELDDELDQFAEQNGLTRSKAIRYLIIQGLTIEERKKQLIADAVRENPGFYEVRQIA
jgi:hypothetical protein